MLRDHGGRKYPAPCLSRAGRLEPRRRGRPPAPVLHSMHIARRPVPVPSPGPALIAAALLLAAASCKSASEQRAAADRQVYALIEERRAALGSTDRPFTIDADPNSLRRRLERGEVHELKSLTMVQCLDIAAENSRDFQSQRESFYLSALDL